MTDYSLIYLYVFYFFVAGICGLERFILAEKETSTRKAVGWSLGGALVGVAAIAWQYGKTAIDDPYRCFAIAVFIGLSPLTTKWLLGELASKVKAMLEILANGKKKPGDN